MKAAQVDIRFDALEYEAPFLIEKLLKECIVETEEEGRALFMEVKRYIVLVQSDNSTIWDMYSLRIDEVWHQFVLFTREYIDFCMRYFGVYVQHRPSNAPQPPANPDEPQRAASTFADLRARYEEFFGIPLPKLWFDETSVTVRRRVVNYNAGQLTIRDGDDGMVELLTTSGAVLMSISELARSAVDFIARTGAFYVRELPGDPTDEEKVAVVVTLVECKVLRVAP
jgi:hypothetical protein